MSNRVLCGYVRYDHVITPNEDNTQVCRLGFNPTEIIEIAEKRVA